MKYTLLFLPLLLMSLPAPARAQEDIVTEPRSYTFIINNSCRRNIRVAVHYRHPELGWVTEGWWNVDGRSELATGIVSSHYQFYVHGNTRGFLQWPPARSRKQYNRYPVVDGEGFRILENQAPGKTQITSVPFSLKEVSPERPGLKARFDC